MPCVTVPFRGVLPDADTKTAAELHREHGQGFTLGGEPGQVFGRVPTYGVVTVAGPPGSGKSTLATKTCDEVARMGFSALYLSFEEGHGETLRERLRRLEIISEHIHFSVATTFEGIKAELERLRPALLVIDSLGMTHFDDEVLVRIAREYELLVFALLHWTKGGMPAGRMSVLHAADVNVSLAPGGAWERTKSRLAGMAEGRLEWKMEG